MNHWSLVFYKYLWIILITFQTFMEIRDDNQASISYNVGMSVSIKRISSTNNTKNTITKLLSHLYILDSLSFSMKPYIQNIYSNSKKLDSIWMDLRIAKRKISHHSQHYKLDEILWQSDRINRSPPFYLHLLSI